MDTFSHLDLKLEYKLSRVKFYRGTEQKMVVKSMTYFVDPGSTVLFENLVFTPIPKPNPTHDVSLKLEGN